MPPIIGQNLTSDTPTNLSRIDVSNQIHELYTNETPFLTLMQMVETERAMSTRIDFSSYAELPIYFNISANISSSATTLVLSSDGTTFNVGDYAQVLSSTARLEIIKITAISGNSLTIERSALGSTAVAIVAASHKLQRLGNISLEGGELARAHSQGLVADFNYCSIIKRTHEYSRTSMLIGDQVSREKAIQRQRRRLVEEFKRDIERSLVFGVRNAGSGSTPRSAGGLFDFQQRSANSNTLNVNGALTKSVLNKFLLEKVFNGSSAKKFALVSDAFMAVLMDLAEKNATVRITPESKSYGLSVLKLLTPAGEIELIQYKPFNSTGTIYSNSALFFDPSNLRIRHIGDMLYDSKMSESFSGSDGMQDQLIYEGCLEVGLPLSTAFLSGATSAG